MIRVHDRVQAARNPFNKAEKQDQRRAWPFHLLPPCRRRGTPAPCLQIDQNEAHTRRCGGLVRRGRWAEAAAAVVALVGRRCARAVRAAARRCRGCAPRSGLQGAWVSRGGRAAGHRRCQRLRPGGHRAFRPSRLPVLTCARVAGLRPCRRVSDHGEVLL